MNVIVENIYFNDDYCYMNSSTGYESNNHNSIYFKGKVMKIIPTDKKSDFEECYGVGIDVMLHASAISHFFNGLYLPSTRDPLYV